MRKNALKQQLRNGQLTLGSWITLAHPAIAEIMATAGFDWLAVDLEHSVITIREAEELIRIIDLAGVVPLVRLTSNDANQIKRVMDAGSHGVIVPMVNCADDAKRAVSAVKYPTKGSRGIGLARAQGYGTSFNEYMTWQEEQSIVIVQIEHIDAVHSIKAILSVEGVDGFIVGPYDLTGSMGIPGQFHHTDFLDALKKVYSVADTLNIPGGIHIVEPDTKQLQEKIDEGLNFIAYSVDIRMLERACHEGVHHIKEATQ